MKKTYKTSEVLSIFSELEKFMKKDMALPARLVWSLDDNYEAMNTIVKKFYKHRDKLLGELKEKGAFDGVGEDGKLKIKEEFKKEVSDAEFALFEFSNIENEVEIAVVGRDCIPEVLSVQDYRALKFMIE